MKTKKQTAYVAIPYSYDPESSFEFANRASAYLIEQGYVVISPISQSHSIADYLDSDLRKDSDFWLEQDLPLLSKCDVLVLVDGIGEKLISKSKGVQAELKFAMENNIPIKTLFLNTKKIYNYSYDKIREYYIPNTDKKEVSGYVSMPKQEIRIKMQDSSV